MKIFKQYLDNASIETPKVGKLKNHTTTPMPPITTIAVAGASGALGTPLVHALLAANFQVTALTRLDSQSTHPPGVKVARVDYTSHSSLSAALTGHDALVVTLTPSASGDQDPIMRAAIAAGVYRIIPSEFGGDMLHPRVRTLPVFKGKRDTQTLVRRLCAESRGTTTFTLVFNNLFLDWGIELGLAIDLAGKKMEFVDGGERYFTAAPLEFIARGVVAILQRPEETADRAIRLSGVRMTQKQLLRIAKKVVGEEGWTVTHIESEELKRRGYEGYRRSTSFGGSWVFDLVKFTLHADGYAGDFAGKEDNELLGLEELDEEEVEEMMRRGVSFNTSYYGL
ncbi:uncharacterized protein LTR77_009812 [Saxophila tyrrhenica]|uniref:NmrA-like domain-containing protein n=1 Tax=Saxophila tyrrhenica TaxID=1690608 RepID=A0AAV9NXK7_9PEZI|nr:hypothetical protein LTR77_009812 [Saxophila tyrrhenica]